MTAPQYLAGRARSPDIAWTDRSRRQLRISAACSKIFVVLSVPTSMSLTGHGRGDAPGSLPGVLARLCREGKEELASSEAGGQMGQG